MLSALARDQWIAEEFPRILPGVHPVENHRPVTSQYRKQVREGFSVNILDGALHRAAELHGGVIASFQPNPLCNQQGRQRHRFGMVEDSTTPNQAD